MAKFVYYVYSDQDNRLLGKTDSRFKAYKIGDDIVGEGNWHIKKRYARQ